MPAEWDGPHLHWDLRGEHVLFPFLVLNTFWSFLLASLVLSVMCILERIISHYHDKQRYSTSALSQSRWGTALWRCLLYWIAMVLRLWYMLATMTFNIGLILVIATSLAITQFIIDIRASSGNENHSFQPLDRHRSSDNYESLQSPTAGSIRSEITVVAPNSRPRSKSKPESIFIHPAQSNIARADAMADHLVLEERMLSNSEHVSTWQEGNGRDLARQFLSRADSTPTHRKSATSKAFKVSEESDSEDDGEDPATRRLVP